MTIDQFLSEFAEVAGEEKWVLDRTTIRTESGYCPINFLAKRRGVLKTDCSEFMTRVCYPTAHADAMGLNPVLGAAVLMAADGMRCHDPEVRRRLLEITKAA